MSSPILLLDPNNIFSYPQKQRKKLSEKIEQLDSAIDDVYNHLWSDKPPNGVAIVADDIEALI